MNSSDQLLRTLFNILFALFIVQIFLLFLLDQNQKSFKKRMLNRAPSSVEISCGMFRNLVLSEKFNYPKFNFQHEDCNSESCRISGYMSLDANKEADTELHIVAVHSGPPIRFSNRGQIRRGKPIYVRIRKTEKPIELVLVNKDRMRWKLDLDEGAEISKLVVASKSLTWVEGQPEEIPIEYLSPSTMCAYPYAFEDEHNPDNVYRRMVSALRQQLKHSEKSFQGAKHGLGFVVPYYDSEENEAKRIAKFQMKQQARKVSMRLPASVKGLSFEVKGFQLAATTKQPWNEQLDMSSSTASDIPEQVQSYVRDSNKDIFVIHRHQFGQWKQGKFEPIYVPVSLPELTWPTALGLNEKTGEIWITSQDGDGRIYGYMTKEKTWRLISESSGANIRAISYSKKLDQFFAIYNEQKIDRIVEFNDKGEIRREVNLSRSIPFLKSDWYPELNWVKNRLVLRLAKPSFPQGDFYSIDVQKGTARKVSIDEVKKSQPTMKSIEG